MKIGYRFLMLFSCLIALSIQAAALDLSQVTFNKVEFWVKNNRIVDGQMVIFLPPAPMAIVVSTAIDLALLIASMRAAGVEPTSKKKWLLGQRVEMEDRDVIVPVEKTPFQFIPNFRGGICG